MTQDMKIQKINPAMAYQKPLEDYIQYLEKLNMRSLPLLEKLAVPGVRYVSALHEAIGRDAVMEVFRLRLEQGRQKFSVLQHSWSGDGQTVFLRWQWRVGEGDDMDITNGVAEVLFSNEGQVMSHHDFSDALYQLPPKPTLWTRLKRRYSSARPGA